MDMGLFFDIALLCLVALTVFICIRRGFVRVVLTLLALVLAAGIALGVTNLLADPVADKATPAMERFIVHQSSRFLPDEDALDTIVSMSDKVVSVVRAVLQRMGGDDAAEAADIGPQEALTALAHGLAFTFYGFLIFILVFALVFAVLQTLVERIRPDNWQIFGIADTALGVALGIVLGTAVLFLPVILLVTAAPKALGGGLAVPKDVFRSSRLLQWTYSLYPFK